MSDNKPYQENENFVPEPTAAFGTLDTSGTAGAAHSRVEAISPVFEVAEKQNALNAAKALDPDDDSVPASLVVVPDSDRSRDDAVEAVKAKAAKAEESEVSLLTERKNPFQKQAELEGDEGAEVAERQRATHGASGGLDGSGVGETRTEPTSEASEAQDKSATPAKKAASSKK